MLINFCFVCTRSGKTCILQINDKKYVFNLFEGFQRYFIEKKFSLSSIDSVFLRNKYDVIPLIGMYLTLCDIPQKVIDVVSYDNLNFFDVHKFAISHGFRLNFMNSFKDKYISVKAIKIGEDNNYIIEIPNIRGKFYPERLPNNFPKSLYKALIQENVVIHDGKEYHQSDYSDKEFNIPKIALISSLIDDVTVFIENFHGVTSIFCFDIRTYNFIVENFSNINIASKSPIEGVHFIADSKTFEFETFYKNQIILNLTDKRYLLPTIHNGPNKYPINTFFDGDCIHYDRSVGFVEKRKDVSLDLQENNKYTSKTPSIEFLGTCCAIPSKLGNVSSILYENDECAMLLDVGEDTFGQILRLHGNLDVLNKVKYIFISHSHADHIIGLAKILKYCSSNIIILSPAYLNHYLKYFNFNYHVMAEPTRNHLKAGINVYFGNNIKSLEHKGRQGLILEDQVTIAEFDDFRIQLCTAPHFIDSMSISVHDLKCNKSFSYSGDSAPSKLFSHISQGVDLMIHEATFNADQKDLAEKTLHTTKNDAISLFKDSGAKKLLLTHFSNRNVGKYDEDFDEYCVSDFYRHVFD